MNIDWRLVAMALGLVMILEGLPYFLAPERIVTVLRAMQELGESRLRWLGFAAMMIGLALLALGRWW